MSNVILDLFKPGAALTDAEFDRIWKTASRAERKAATEYLQHMFLHPELLFKGREVAVDPATIPEPTLRKWSDLVETPRAGFRRKRKSVDVAAVMPVAA